MNKQRVIEGSIVTALGLTTVGLSRGYTYMDRYTPGPGLFPLWLGVLLTVFGAIVLLTGLASPGERPKAAALRPGDLVPLAVLALLVAGMELLGALVSIAVFNMILVRLLGRRTSWPAAAVVGIGVSIGCYLIFERLLGVPLPKGLLGI